jgi:hypothetical protein
MALELGPNNENAKRVVDRTLNFMISVSFEVSSAFSFIDHTKFLDIVSAHILSGKWCFL